MVLPVAKSTNLQGHGTISQEELSPRQYQSQQRQFFLEAPAGTGKRLLIDAIHYFLNSKRKTCISVAIPAVAAQLLCKGRTPHSKFLILIPFNEDSICYIEVRTGQASKLKQADLNIWNEVMVCMRHNIEAVDRTLNNFMRSKIAFER